MFIDGLKKTADDMIKKLRNVFYTLIPSPAGRLVFRSIAAFCIGAAVCAAGAALIGGARTENGVGGLETPGVPKFSEDVLSVTDSSASDEDIASAAALLPESETSAKELTYFTYRVKSGDMIGIIADTFGVTQDTIISVNAIRQSRLLQVGQYLKIPSMPGILYTVKQTGETPETIAAKFEVSADKCALVNSLSKNAAMDSGVTIFVPDAELDWVTKQEINGDLFRRPLHGRYWLSSYYGWRKSPFTGSRTFHSGIDMAAPHGTPVYASLPGRVAAVGYNETYGNYVIISHHSGYRTLYGHMSAVLVVRGQNVDMNTRIGRVGNTGLSTGPHLHFTVFKGGKTVNPLGLLR